MNRFHPRRTGLALALLSIAGTAFAAGMSKADFDAGNDRIAAAYKAEKTACEQSSGDAHHLCLTRASSKEKVARAQLAFDQSGKADDRHTLALTVADSELAISKDACSDKAGQTKDVCLAEAKAAHTKAVADATLRRKVGTARSDAANDKRDADYQLANEKCDSLAGDAKTACTADAKARFGKS